MEHICTTPQPTRGELLGMIPLLDYAVPTMPRQMSRREWRSNGYLVKQRQEPIRKDFHEHGKYFKGKWHPWYVGIYTKQQCIAADEHAAEQERRVASKQEWETIGGIGKGLKVMTERVKALTDGARRIYGHLHDKAHAEDTAVIVTNNDELRAACNIRRNDLKSYRDELIRHGFIQYKLTDGRQSQITVNALL